MKWIPVSERLPDDNREVLISLEWGIDIGTYERGEWRSEWINHYDDDDVLAWMPLPKPYKAGRKTEPTAYADGYADGQRDERERWERMTDRKTENSSEKPNNCEHITEDDAYYIVFKDLTKDEGLFTGKYDAKHGNKHYMYGINSVIEYIAYRVGKDCFNAFNEHFTNNMIKSEKAKEQNNE